MFPHRCGLQSNTWDRIPSPVNGVQWRAGAPAPRFGPSEKGYISADHGSMQEDYDMIMHSVSLIHSVFSFLFSGAQDDHRRPAPKTPFKN